MRFRILTVVMMGLMTLVGLQPSQASDATTRVIVRLDEVGGSSSPISGSLTFTVEDPDSEAVRKVTIAEGRGRVDLPLDSTWRICPLLSGFWAPCRSLSVPAVDDGQPLVQNLRVWPLGELVGRVTVQDGVEGPSSLVARFEPLPGAAGNRPPSGQIPCTLEPEGRFRCPAPAGRLDVSLRADGFVHLYHWNVQVGAGEVVPLGSQKLVAGASLVGTVTVVEGEVDPETARAALRPHVPAGPGTSTGRRLAGLQMEAPVLENGFFQFRGVEPGTWVLEVSQRGLAPGRVFPLEIWSGEETSLREPVELRPPVDLILDFSPPLDWLQRPWRVEVRRSSDFSAGTDGEAAYVGTAGAEGRVRVTGQAPGSFSVAVRDSQGSQVFFEHALPVRGHGEVRHGIDIEQIPVEGRVSLGDEPVLGRLWFGGPRGGLRSEMASDLEGDFAGVLPRDGWWWVRVEGEEPALHTEVRVEVVAGGDGVAQVDVELPDTELFGRVVSADGTPVAEARVIAVTAGRRQRTEVDGDGAFTFRALPEGPVMVSASGRGAGGPQDSDGITVPLTAPAPTGPVELVLRPTRLVEGQVVSPSGGAVRGAVVDLVTMEPPRAGFADHARSDVTGRFRVRVRDDARRLQATVSPPGHAMKTMIVESPAAGAPLVVTVPREGGTVEIRGEEQTEGEQELPLHLTLFQDGLPLSPQRLFQWGRGHGEPWPAGEGLLRIPRLAPGHYRACLVDPRRSAGYALAGADWMQELQGCDDGFLAPGGTLELRPVHGER